MKIEIPFSSRREGVSKCSTENRRRSRARADLQFHSDGKSQFTC